MTYKHIEILDLKASFCIDFYMKFKCMTYIVCSKTGI